jgi:hypothetical protein
VVREWEEVKNSCGYEAKASQSREGVMKATTALLALGLAIAVGGCQRNKSGPTKDDPPAPAKDDPPEARARGTFTVGRATTYIEAPLDGSKHIDYEAALNERLSKGVTPENNALALLWKSIGPNPTEGTPFPPGYFERIGISVPPQVGAYFVSLRRFEDEHNLAPDERKWNTELVKELQRQPWIAKEHPNLDSWLKANDKPLAVAIEATKRTHYYSPVISNRTGKGQMGLFGAFLPANEAARELAGALVIRAVLRVGRGDVDAAWQDILACHRLGRLVGRGGTLIEGLVGAAIEQDACNAEIAFLHHSAPNKKRLMGYVRDLQALPLPSSMADKVDLSERFSLLDLLMSVDVYGFNAFEDKPDIIQEAVTELMLDGIDWDPVLKATNEWLDRLVINMRMKNRTERAREYKRLMDELNVIRKQRGKDRANALADETARGTPPGTAKGKVMAGILVPLMLPAANKCADAEDRASQSYTNVLAAFALAAYHRDNGKYPDRLDALAPKYLKEIPRDLFTGNALIYRPAANNYLLYSVGMNGKDDDGRGPDVEPPGDDLVVRMPPTR